MTKPTDNAVEVVAMRPRDAAIETICGYRVHPAVSIFPLIEGDEFKQLVDSISRNGMYYPIVLHEGQLLDGRNRLRAVEAARDQGHKVDVPTVQWQDEGHSVSEWIWDTNATRRQMTVDGLAMASASIAIMVVAENAERKKASQQHAGEPSKNPAGRRGKEPVNPFSDSPVPATRDAAKSNAASTIGKIAAKAGVSRHKATQALAVHKAIEAGGLPAETAKAVMSGKKKLKDVATKKPVKPVVHRSEKAILTGILDLIAEWKNADHNMRVLRDELETQIGRI